MVRELDTNVTSSGLTIEEEEIYENKYNAELACNRVQLCENEIDKIKRYIDPDYPEEWKPPRANAKLRWWQELIKVINKIKRYSEPDHPEEWKPPRANAKLSWWEQKLNKAEVQDKFNADRLQRENEATKENEKTAKELEDAKPLLEKHSNIGKGRRKHNSLLNNFIDNFDKEFSKNRKKVPSAKALESEMKKYLRNNLEKHSFVIEVVDKNDCINWRDDKGNIKSSLWGEPMRARITRIRKKRNNQ